MISNRDTNNNLANEVLKKKKAMQAQNNSEKKRMMIGYIVIGSIALILLFFYFLNSSNEKTDSIDFETAETASDKYNSKLEALQAKKKSNNNDNLLDVFSNTVKDTAVVFNKDEEHLKKQIDELGKKKTKVKRTKKSKPSNDDVYGDYSMWEDEGEKKYKASVVRESSESEQMAEYKRLAEMKAFMLKNSQDYSRAESPILETKREDNSVHTRAAVYKNQFVLPGDRVKLILTHSLVLNGNLFEKNTPVYAMVNINKSRVLLDIENINGIPVNLIVKDINDQMVGLYNKRAGELWSDYQKEQNDDLVNGVSNEINTGSTIINSSIRTIGNFFKRKKIKETNKILLINDHEVILTKKKQ